jgi:hypothetical protein
MVDLASTPTPDALQLLLSHISTGRRERCCVLGAVHCFQQCNEALTDEFQREVETACAYGGVVWAEAFLRHFGDG